MIFQKLRALGLISIVGQTSQDGPAPMPATGPYPSRDPGWYAEQAAKLRHQLEQRQAQFRGYLEALRDARCLKNMTGGMKHGRSSTFWMTWHVAMTSRRACCVLIEGSLGEVDSSLCVVQSAFSTEGMVSIL